jgi:hypothetical protein
MLREDQLPIYLDVEYASLARDEFGNDVATLLDLGRQTGGLGFVVSTRAVSDSDDHFFSWFVFSDSTASDHVGSTQFSSMPLGARCFMNPNM